MEIIGDLYRRFQFIDQWNKFEVWISKLSLKYYKVYRVQIKSFKSISYVGIRTFGEMSPTETNSSLISISRQKKIYYRSRNFKRNLSSHGSKQKSY